MATRWHPNARRGILLWHRRQQCARLHAMGFTNPQIAERVDIPVHQVQRDLAHLKLTPRRTQKLPAVVAGKYGTPLLELLRTAPRWVSTPWVIEQLAPDRYRTFESRYRIALRRLELDGLVTSVHERNGPSNTLYWIWSERLPMTLDEAQAMVRRGVLYGDVFSLVDESAQSQLKEWYLSEPDLPNLAGRTKKQVVPVPSGDMCNKCGGHMVRTGTCMTCSSCGESSGGCG